MSDIISYKDTVPREQQTPEDRGIGPYFYMGSLVSALFLLLTILTQLFTRLVFDLKTI